MCFRFYQGRRTEDDRRQIGRWLRCAGKTGRWRNNLISKCVKSGCGYDNHGISPVVRQTLQHWGYKLNKEDFDAYAKQKRLLWDEMWRKPSASIFDWTEGKVRGHSTLGACRICSKYSNVDVNSQEMYISFFSVMRVSSPCVCVQLQIPDALDVKKWGLQLQWWSK